MTPRIAAVGEDLIGKVATCSLGRVGLVVGKQSITFANGDSGEFWTGIGFDGKGLWATGTMKPVVILTETVGEYADLIKRRPSNVLYGTIGVAPAK